MSLQKGEFFVLQGDVIRYFRIVQKGYFKYIVTDSKGNEHITSLALPGKILINNESRSFYLYDDDKALKQTGSYNFFVENNVPYMVLTFNEKLENKSVYKYDLTGTSENTFFALKIQLGWDWHEQTESMETREISPATMNAKDVETGVQYYFVVGNHDMPENVLE